MADRPGRPVERVKNFTYNNPQRRASIVNLSLEQLLNQTATRGSWYGGGSVAAMACAASAALLEKLLNPVASSRAGGAVTPHPASKSMRAIRATTLRLIQRDAQAFSRVIKAYYQHDKAAIRRSLKEATEIPLTIALSARRVTATARQLKPQIKPRYRSDLTCVEALATAARTAAEAFVDTNLAWLNDAAYTARVRKQLALAGPARQAVARARA
jgi:formiminotetrahydrofolate cyclodeaminase